MPQSHRAAVTKVLVDSSVWIDFTRGRPETRQILKLLEGGRVMTHILVEAELRAGNLNIDRGEFFETMQSLEYAPPIAYDELFEFIERRRLFAKGVSFVDVMLLMSAMLCGAQLWTHDKSLIKLGAELRFEIYGS